MFTLKTTHTHVIILVSLCEVILVLKEEERHDERGKIECFDTVTKQWKILGRLPQKVRWPVVVKSGE